MKKMILMVALAIASLNAAHAQNNGPVYGSPRLFIGTGLTGGGDKLATVEYYDGYERDIKGGGFFQAGVGVDLRVTEEFSLQASYNYHYDSDSARDSDFKFSRSPIELMAYYHVAQNWRIGAGARYVGNAKIQDYGYTQKFDNTVGAVIEAEYLLGNHFGFKLRYVSEKYETTFGPYKYKFDGNHAGAFVNFYF